MNVLAVLALMVIIALVLGTVSAPLRRGVTDSPSAQRAELEAAKEAKYREIRDAELDFRTGKLSDTDYRAVDRSLRGEAIDILDRIDALGQRS